MAQIIPLNSIFERSPAKVKKFREPIVFVHHYGGNKHSFSRHIEWVNELGFDAVSFDLPLGSPAQSHVDSTTFPIDHEWNIGLRHIWTDKIEEVLGRLPENKFMFSFSYPSVSVLAAIGRRHAIDVKGWITDGGPFKHVRLGVQHLVNSESLRSVLETQGGKHSWLHWAVEKIPAIRPLVSEITALAFGLINYDRDVEQSLAKLPLGFPVLSLRGEKDELVQPFMIDDFFSTAFNRLDFQRFLLSQSGHLNGFRNDGEIYRQVVSAFLNERGTRV